MTVSRDTATRIRNVYDEIAEAEDALLFLETGSDACVLTFCVPGGVDRSFGVSPKIAVDALRAHLAAKRDELEDVSRQAAGEARS